MTVKSTQNYSQFKTVLGNRLLSREHIARLVREIERNNLLATQPILVNEKMEIIDGQHRLEAAKKIGATIYYVQVPGLGIEHVVRLNNTQRRWGVYEYIQLHVDHGNAHYQQLQDFIHKNKR